jgi:hypothetical protein
MEVKIEFKASSDDKSDWFSDHVLTKEQVAQLIRNKVDRAKIYQLRAEHKYLLED